MGTCCPYLQVRAKAPIRQARHPFWCPIGAVNRGATTAWGYQYALPESLLEKDPGHFCHQVLGGPGVLVQHNWRSVEIGLRQLATGVHRGDPVRPRRPQAGGRRCRRLPPRANRRSQKCTPPPCHRSCVQCLGGKEHCLFGLQSRVLRFVRTDRSETHSAGFDRHYHPGRSCYVCSKPLCARDAPYRPTERGRATISNVWRG